MAGEKHNQKVRAEMEEPQTLSPREPPALDEAIFQQLLEAAYVLQKQNGQHPPDEPPRANPAKPDPVEALSEIVETQEILRSQPYDLPQAANLIAQRLAKITHASGVAVAIVRDDHLEYCAGAGSLASLAGTRLPWDPNLSAGTALPDGAGERGGSLANSLPPTQVCEENSVKSPFLIPIHHEGKVAGLLELRFANPDSIEEQDVQSCRLMAGLMSEAITREAELQWKRALAAERATMLGALERIKPQLERLAVEPDAEAKDHAEAVPPAPGIAETSLTAPNIPADAPAAPDVVCRQCGFLFAGVKDLFCGRCGAPRAVESWPVDPLQSNDDLRSRLDSPWHSQLAGEETQGEETWQLIEEGQNQGEEPEDGFELARHSSLSPAPEEFSEEAKPAIESDSALAVRGPAAEKISLPGEHSDQPSHAPWSSAAKTHKWLQSLDTDAPAGIWLTKHRANIYVGAALILLLMVLSGWGTPPRYHGAPGKNQLTLSDRLLISLGLAEAPPTPVYTGNPNTQVWVDLHTALYYCPGSDLYGKTPGGKFTTQRDAQLDQFEPAARKSCD